MGKFFQNLINSLRTYKVYKVVVKVKIGKETSFVEQEVKAYTRREASRLAVDETVNLVQLYPVQVWRKKTRK